MSTSRLTRVLLLTGVLAASGLGSACSKTPDAVTAGTTQPATTTATKVDAASAGGTKATCEPAALIPVIQKKYADAGVDHLVCLAPNAIITVKTGAADTVAFLAQQSGQWAVIVDGPAADAESLRPKDFPESLVRSWLDKRTPAPERAASDQPTTTKRGRTGSGPDQQCSGEGADVKCVTVTTAKETTTRPPTTKPTVTEPPPTPAPTTPPTTFSQFCLENPLDPSCSGKK